MSPSKKKPSVRSKQPDPMQNKLVSMSQDAADGASEKPSIQMSLDVQDKQDEVPSVSREEAIAPQEPTNELPVVEQEQVIDLPQVNEAEKPVIERLCLSYLTLLRLRAALFVCGIVVMSLEIFSTHIITPHFGSGLYVWASLQTVALAALGLGHWLGGRWADKQPAVKHLSIILAAAAVALLALPLLRESVLYGSWHLGLRAGSLAAAILLFFLPYFFLGMVPVFIARLEADKVERAGSSVGRLFGIFLAGSLVGVLFTGFFLIPSFRLPTALVYLAALQAFTAFVVFEFGSSRRIIIRRKKPKSEPLPPEDHTRRRRRRRIPHSVSMPVVLGLAALGASALGAWAAWPRERPAELLAMRSRDGADLRVFQHNGIRQLYVNQMLNSSFNSQGRLLDKHAYVLTARLLMARPKARKIALVGLGSGGLVPLLQEHQYHVEAVEISSDMAGLSQSHFGLSLPQSNIHIMSGRAYLREQPGRFDVVVLDTLSSEATTESLLSVEGFAAAKSALIEGGLFVISTAGIDTEHRIPNQMGAAVHQTLGLAFRYILAVPTSSSLLLFASDLPITPNVNSVILTTYDGFRPFSWLDAPVIRWPHAPVLSDSWNALHVLDNADKESYRLSRRESYTDQVMAALYWE